ncbi:MAG TPA: dihydroorotase [Candidatus Agathobaculum pullistercoris]|nr:dihydroorotase [uncultured Agathobaculum sp.]HIX10890.1 dihydroorotase [Candidatus Agathobaculum pullistercoris]
MLLIRNGRVLDPYTNINAQMDILIGDDGVIRELGPQLDEPAGCAVYDAAGLTVSPGFVDGHVHFRDPGQTQKEDVLTGAAAAAAGGYATVICMANTLPTCDTPEIIRYVTDKAKDCPVEVLQAGAVTKGLKGQELTDFAALQAAGAPCLTDDGINLTNAGLCRAAMEQAAERDILLSFHEEEPSLVPSPGVNFGSAAAQQFGVPGARASAETAMIARDIALALDTGARVLFQHVSSAQSAALIRAGKKLGARIYAEVTPHHISLTEDDVLAHGTYARMNPPLRREADREALIDALADGTIDMIATDHAPHTAEEKAREFAKAPSGITGLETAFSVCNTYLVQTGRLTPMQLVDRMSKAPAEIYGLTGRAVAAGNYARLVLLDWDSRMVYKTYRSKAVNTPYTGMQLTGAPRAIVTGARVTVR